MYRPNLPYLNVNRYTQPRITANGLPVAFLREIRQDARCKMPKPVIISVTEITAGGEHVWCETNVGRIRKPISEVPKDLFAKFYISLLEARYGNDSIETI